jgi:hypothetical protein
MPSDPVNAYYLRMLSVAEGVLEGPRAVSHRDEFWGQCVLFLRRERMPKIEGTITSRSIYANPCDDEQDQAILRYASWDAKKPRQDALRLFRKNGTVPSSTLPFLSLSYTWIALDIFYEAIQLLEDLHVPLRVPKNIPRSRQIYHLGIDRMDRSSAKVVWGSCFPGNFRALSEGWETIWKELAAQSHSGPTLVPEETWPFGYELDYTVRRCE